MQSKSKGVIMQTKVINLFGAPGTGKSTIAAYIFAKLKAQKINCELVTEFAKDLCWDNNLDALANQYYIFGAQSYRLSRLVGKVDIIICDSPLPLSIVYAQEHISRHFADVVLDDFNQYDNYNYLLLNTSKNYVNTGRIHNAQESAKIQIDIQHMLNAKAIYYTPIAFSHLDAAIVIIKNYLHKQKTISFKNTTQGDSK